MLTKNIISDLTAYTGSETTIEVLGYNAVYDGGGGIFFLKAIADLPSDYLDDVGGFFFVAATSLGSTMWVRRDLFDTEAKFINVRWFGVFPVAPTASSPADNRTKIQQALNSCSRKGRACLMNAQTGVKTVYFISRDPLTSYGISIPADTRLIINKRATLMPLEGATGSWDPEPPAEGCSWGPSDNKSLVKFGVNAAIEGDGIIDLDDYLINGIWVDGADEHNMQNTSGICIRIKALRLAQQVGIFFDVKGASKVASWLKVDVRFINLYYGVYMLAEAGGYSNANYIRITGSCINHLRMECLDDDEGTGVNGNNLDGVYQTIAPPNGSLTPIFCSGVGNTFNIKIYDYSIKNSKADDVAVMFTNLSKDNIVNITNLPGNFILDEGTGNKIEGIFTYNRYHNTIPSVMPKSSRWTRYGGNQDDYLLFSDLKPFSISLYDMDGDTPVGPSSAVTNIQNAFNLDPGTYATIVYASLSGDLLGLRMEISFPTGTYCIFPDVIGMIFHDFRFPKSVNISIKDDAGEWYYIAERIFSTPDPCTPGVPIGNLSPEILAMCTQRAYQIVSGAPVFSTVQNMTAIRFDMYGYGNSTDVKLEKVFLLSKGSESETFLPVGGGKMYGNINANNKQILNQGLNGSTAYSASLSFAPGDSTITPVTITGAALGDLVLASYDQDLQGLVISGTVVAANSVEVTLLNPTTGSGVTLTSGNLRVRVLK